MIKLIDYIGAFIFLAGILITAGCIENLIWPGIILGLVLTCTTAAIGAHHEATDTKIH